MKTLLWCAGLLVSTTAFGQDKSGMTCTASGPTSPVIVRSEGITELVGDLLLQCTGGTPTAAGKVIPTTNVRLSLNTAITSRLLAGGFADALFLIDDPYPGSSLPPSTPTFCAQQPVSLIATGDGRTNGQAGSCNYLLGQYRSANTVTWPGVPVDPPGPGKTRTLRITNIRANANQLLQSPSVVTAQISGSVSIDGIPVTNPQQTLAFAGPGATVGVTSGSAQVCNGFNGGNIFSLGASGAIDPSIFVIKVQEGFPGSFKPKGSAQYTSGVVYGTESGRNMPPSSGGPVGIGDVINGTKYELILMTPATIPTFFGTIPESFPLVDSTGAEKGTVSVTSPNGVVFGNSITAALYSKNFILFEVTAVTDPNRTGPLNLIVPVTVTGTTSSAPLNLAGSIGFATTSNTSVTLLPQNPPPIPAFSLLNSGGVSSPALDPSLLLMSIVPCTTLSGTLGATATTPIIFNSAVGSTPGSTPGPAPQAQPEAVALPPSLIAPRVSTVGLVSTALATTNVSVTKDPSATWLNVSLSGATTPVTASLSVSDVAAGSYSTTLKFSAPGVPGAVSVPVTYTVAPAPWFTRYGFANSASYVNNVVAPGEPFVIFGGDAFGPAALAGPALGADGRAVTTLGSTQVLFDGTPAPLYYSVNASGVGQVAGFAPFSLAGKAQTNVQVVYNGVASPPISLSVLDAVPGLYTADSSGGGQGSILNQDASVNGPASPESPGNVIVLYGGGAGQTSPSGRDGALAGVGGTLAQFTLPVKVFIDGIAATDIPYAGPAPGLVEGVFQINVRIPAGVRHNANVPVLVQIEDKQTQPGVTIATK